MAFSAIERESAKMGLTVNVVKKKYILSASGVVPRMGSQVTANSYNFDVVKEFIYIGTAINTNNDVTLETKRRVTPANRCYFGVISQLSSRDLSSATTVSEPTSTIQLLLFNEMDVAKRINIQRFRWLCPIVRMDEDAPPRRVFETAFGDHRRQGRTRWKDQVEVVLTSLSITDWRKRPQRRSAWREA